MKFGWDIRRSSAWVACLALTAQAGLIAFAAGCIQDPRALEIRNGSLRPRQPVKDGVEPATGLQRAFPPVILRPDNPTTLARVELGRLLFFDPVLSNDNKTSCAHCHHPDFGFSDGRERSMGYGAEGVGLKRSGGDVLPRHAPTLWNTVFSKGQFWDGRAKDLEDQARGPITDQHEMKQDPQTLAAELLAIPDYRKLFDQAFGGKNGSAISFMNVTKAIAAFERTLVSLNSRYDYYAAGDSTALNASEVRGLKLFLSTKARCAECHGLPNFSNQDFKVIGVPDVPGKPADPHRDEAAPGRGGGPNGAFKIPTLRNVALHPPYMHNGSLKNLDEVLDFYSKGGGRGKGLTIPLQDEKIRKYDLSKQERTDLKAFLHALTDASAMPVIPRSVPSGLDVVPRSAPLPQAIKNNIHGSWTESLAIHRHRELSRTKVVDVRRGQSIQEAVDRAGRDGIVRIHPGVYHEDVLVIHHGVTIEGVSEDGKSAVLDGQNKLSDAVVAMGNRFTIRNLEIRNFTGNGVVARGGHNVTFRNLVVDSTGDYGIYPVECDGVLIEGCTVTGAKDAGLYVGQSRNIVVRGNEVHHCVAGIEIENSVGSVVENNYVHDNSGGILVFVLPFNVAKECRVTRVTHNQVIHNNTANFAAPNAFVRNVLSGSGIMVLAADETEVAENEIAENGSFGIAVAGLRTVFPSNTQFDVDPNPDRTWIHDNTLKGNATKPDARLKQFGVPPRDLIWDLSGKGNAWDQPGATSFPPKLPVRAASR